MRISDWSSDVCSSDLVVLARGGEHAAGEAVARFVRSHQQGCGAMAEAVAGRLRAAAPGEYQCPKQPANRADRVVAQRRGQGEFGAVHGVVERPRQQRLVAHRAAFVLVALEHRAGHVRSEEHTSELQSLMRISYAVFCLKKKKNTNIMQTHYFTHILN